jgi:hypothetical protein
MEDSLFGRMYVIERTGKKWPMMVRELYIFDDGRYLEGQITLANDPIETVERLPPDVYFDLRSGYVIVTKDKRVFSVNIHGDSRYQKMFIDVLYTMRQNREQQDTFLDDLIAYALL